jgi:hypothetical protein
MRRACWGAELWVRWWLDGDTEWDRGCCLERRLSVSLSLWARVHSRLWGLESGAVWVCCVGYPPRPEVVTGGEFLWSRWSLYIGDMLR